MSKYIVQHTGYPVGARAIRPDEWVKLSEHKTESAAWKRIEKETAHLDYGQWDDHYRVIAPDGSVCSRDQYYARVEWESDRREIRRMQARERR